nr:MAG TPA: hypothetical protein [Bacteriophage sp.]
MKVTGFNKYTGVPVYELEMTDCGPENIADVSRYVRFSECWAYINDIPTRQEYEDENDTFFAAVSAGLAAAKFNGFRPFDVGDYVTYQSHGNNQLGRVAKFSNFDRGKVFVCYHKGCATTLTDIADLRPATRAEEDRAVQEGRVFGYHRFDDRCPDYSDACYPFCPQFDGQEVEQ